MTTTDKEIEFFILHWDTSLMIELQVNDLLSKYKKCNWFTYEWRLTVIPITVNEFWWIPHTEFRYVYELTIKYFN